MSEETGRRPEDRPPKPPPKTTWAHHCKACDAKWTAPFPVPTCPRCGVDDSAPGRARAIVRVHCRLTRQGDGEPRLKLHLRRVLPPEEPGGKGESE